MDETSLVRKSAPNALNEAEISAYCWRNVPPNPGFRNKDSCVSIREFRALWHFLTEVTIYFAAAARTHNCGV